MSVVCFADQNYTGAFSVSQACAKVGTSKNGFHSLSLKELLLEILFAVAGFLTAWRRTD